MNDSIDFQFVVENAASAVEPRLRVLENEIPTWNIIILLVAVLILALSKHLFTRREFNPIVSFNGMLMALIYIALVSFLVQKIVLVFSGNRFLYYGFGFYLDVVVFVSAYLILQYLFAIFFGWLFGFEKAAMHHEIRHLTTMASLDIVLAVFTLVIFFYPTKIILIITASIILIITAIRIIKTFFEVQFLSKMNLFNYFLYFCTLEIIPITIAITMVCRLIAKH